MVSLWIMAFLLCVCCFLKILSTHQNIYKAVIQILILPLYRLCASQEYSAVTCNMCNSSVQRQNGLSIYLKQ